MWSDSLKRLERQQMTKQDLCCLWRRLYKRDAPPPVPPGDFPFGESHQSHSAPKGFTCFAGSSRLGWPQEVRIRDIPIPDAHAQHPCCAPLGSTSACPRRSLAYGAGNPPRFNAGGVGPRMARPSDASLWPRAEGARQDDARGPPGQGRAVGTPPRQRRVRAGGVAPSGEALLWDLSCRDK